MTQCRIIKSPVNGEDVKSELWNSLFSRILDAQKADEAYERLTSDEFVYRFGNWRKGTYSLKTNKHGEPIYSNIIGDFLDINKLKSDDSLKSKVQEFLKNTGFTISYEEFEKRLGSPVAIVDFFNKTIKIDEGKADATTLTEEAMHVYVEVVKKHNETLYNSLYQDVLNRPEYDDVLKEYADVYNGDYQQMVDEAIAKTLTNVLINKQSDKPVVTNRIKSWFDKVVKLTKNLLGIGSEQFNDVFELAADNFIENTSKVYTLDRSNVRMYQMSNSVTSEQQKIVDRITSEQLKLNTDGTKYIDTRTGEELDRVHKLVEASKPKNVGLGQTDEQKKKAETASEYGTAGHSDIVNIITRKLEQLKGIKSEDLTPKTKNLNGELYSQLENYFDRWTTEMLEIDENGVFILENTIRDAKYGGTPDLLFVESDGTVHIYDWKFVGYEVTEDGLVKEDVVKQGRRNEWYVQMQKYKEMLSKRYGVTKFGLTRFKPIASFYNKDEKGEYYLSKIEIGDDKVYLKDLPLPDEKTGDSNLDLLISKAIKQAEGLKKRNYANKKEFEDAQAEINTINNYILKLQQSRDNSALIKYVNGKIDRFEKMLVSDEFTDEFADIIDFVNFFEIVQRYYANQNFDNELRNQFADLSSRMITLKVAYYSKLEMFQRDNNISSVNHTVGWLEGKTVMLHQFKNDVFRYFNGLKEKAFDIVDRNITNFNSEVKQLIEKSKNEGNSFNDIIQETKTGYSLVSQYQKEFFEKIKDADVKWLKDNIQVVDKITDEDGTELTAKEYFDKQLAELRDSDRLKLLPQADADRVIERFNYKFNVFDDKYKTEAMKYYQQVGYHKYLQPVDSWKNEKYVWLENNKDKAISKLYFKFVDINKRADLINDKHIRSNFLPMIEKDTIEQLRTNGISIDSLRKDFFEDLKYYDVNPDKLSIKYTHQLDKKDISLDLGVVFSKYAYNVFYNEEFSKLDNKGKILQNILQSGQYYKKKGDGTIETDNGTPKIIDYMTGENDDKAAIDNTVNTFNDFLDKYLKGIDNKSKDIKLFGYDLSANKIVSKLQSYYSATALTLSPISAAVNLTGGLANLHIVATKAKFFDNKQVLEATSELTMFNKKAIQLSKFFNVTSAESKFSDANKLSQESIKYDGEWKYILQRKGEQFVQNSTLIAYLKNLDIVDGEIKKSENGSNLYDKLVKDGNIDLSIINEAQYDSIRRKVRALNNEIMGSLTERDFVTAQQYLGGRLLLHFRRWALPMTKARFGSLGYNSNLEEYEEGRYRQAVKLFLTGHAIPETLGILKDAITLNFNGQYKGMQVLYERAKAKDPNMNMEFAEFQEFYLRNLRATVGELGIILGLLGLAMALVPEDDEEIDGVTAIASKVISRTSQELLFWTDYDSAKRIISAPIPILGLLDKTNRIFDEVVKMAEGEDNKLGQRLMKLTPLNPILSIEQQIEEVNK